ncbi:hypothetical protein AB3331_02360 [Streptococcus sp. H49]|uniref:spr1630 family ClpXP-sensitive toxin n=1 Tax=Streptococcus huangxiaojuni TaxID=3237239 RepID=UPI0034A2815B
MNKLDILSEEQCQLFVDALLKGNEEFCEEMKVKENTEPIYSAAKNGRGNKIDSRLIKTFKDKKLSFIRNYSIKPAGYNWHYGEYICETPFGRFLFIIKSDKALKRAFPKSNSDDSFPEDEDKKYFENYVGINKKTIRQSKKPIEGLFEQPISLFEDEKEAVISLIADEEIYEDIDYFFVLVYKISGERLISAQLIFPNPDTNESRQAQDLTEYIQSSQFNSNDNSQRNNPITSPQESDDDIASFDERIAEAGKSK